MMHGTAAIALAVVMGVAPVEAPAPEALPLRPRQIEGPAPPPVTTPPVTSEPVPAEAVMTEPEPEPVVAPGPAAGPMVRVEDIPTPPDLRAPPPRWDGRGLLIGAGVMGVVNVGLAGARLGLSLGEVTADK